MATADLHNELREPSPLTVDLALTSVDLAALRARRGVETLDQEARQAAKLLTNYYERQLRMGSASGEISEALVPDKSFRKAIQQSLASITETKRGLDAAAKELLEKLVRLLSNLANTGRCEREQARELHAALREFDAERAAPSPRTDETKLWELFNAFS